MRKIKLNRFVHKGKNKYQVDLKCVGHPNHNI